MCCDILIFYTSQLREFVSHVEYLEGAEVLLGKEKIQKADNFLIAQINNCQQCQENLDDTKERCKEKIADQDEEEEKEKEEKKHAHSSKEDEDKEDEKDKEEKGKEKDINDEEEEFNLKEELKEKEKEDEKKKERRQNKTE